MYTDRSVDCQRFDREVVFSCNELPASAIELHVTVETDRTYQDLISGTYTTERGGDRRGKVHRYKYRKHSRTDILRKCQCSQYSRIGSSARS